MTFRKEVFEKCEIAVLSGEQIIDLSGRSTGSLQSARSYISDYNAKNNLDIRSRFSKNDNHLILYKFIEVVKPRKEPAEQIFIPVRLYAFLNGRRYTDQDLLEIANFSKKLNDFVEEVCYLKSNETENLI